MFRANDALVDSKAATESNTISEPASSGGGGRKLGPLVLLGLLLLTYVQWWLRRRVRLNGALAGRHFFVPACIILALSGAPGAASALTFIVNSTADTPDFAINSVCDDGTGHCTLRAAVEEANGNPGADTINFDSTIDGMPIVLTLHGAGEDAAATGDLDITDDVTIDGRNYLNTIIDGDGADRVFDVISGTLDLQHVDVRNGGGVDLGAGIRVRQNATMNLFNAHVTDNHASGSSTVFGGGIRVDQTASFGADASLISGNSAQSSGSTAEGGGLDVETSNTIGILSTEISGNTATSTTGVAAGGGISSTAPLTLQGGIVIGNTAHSDSNEAYGGGISAANGSLTLSQVELSGNTSESPNGTAIGGGIESGYPTTLINTSVFKNQAADRSGGIDMNGSALLTLVNVTVSGNGSSKGGALTLLSNSSLSIADTILAANSGSDPDCYDNGASAITSYGYNLIGDTTGCAIVTTSGDQFGTASNPIDPLLGSPVSIGNGEHGLLPLAGSPALDKADPQLQSQGGTCQATDQAGNSRPFDGDGNGTATCDIGAVERQVNRVPMAQAGSLATGQGQAASGTLAATDADGDPLMYTLGQQPAHGTVSITNASTGNFSYTPDTGYSGSDSFTFTASDGFDTSAAATESITVNVPVSSGGGSLGICELVALSLVLVASGRRQ